LKNPDTKSELLNKNLFYLLKEKDAVSDTLNASDEDE